MNSLEELKSPHYMAFEIPGLLLKIENKNGLKINKFYFIKYGGILYKGEIINKEPLQIKLLYTYIKDEWKEISPIEMEKPIGVDFFIRKPSGAPKGGRRKSKRSKKTRKNKRHTRK